MQGSQPGVLEPVLFPAADPLERLGLQQNASHFSEQLQLLQASNFLINGLPKSKMPQVQIVSWQGDPLTLGTMSPEEPSEDMGQNTRDAISQWKHKWDSEGQRKQVPGAGRLLCQARDSLAGMEQRKENFSSSLLKSESMEQDNVVFSARAAVLCQRTVHPCENT